MSQVILDKQMLAKLGNLAERVELLDESGRVVGYFAPVRGGLPEGFMEPPITAEEIERLKKEPGRPLKDILADLRRNS